MIKKTIAICAMLVLLTACGSGQATSTGGDSAQAATRTDSILIKKLQALQAQGKVAFGHHDDTAYGYRWAYAPDSSDVKNVTGSYPAILDWDLGLIEWGCDRNLDGVPFDFQAEQIRVHDARGGFNAISWHPRNPVSGQDAWDRSVTNTIEQILQEGSAPNDTIKKWIGLTADFIGALRNDSGERIPVIFRPWHEHTGDWFWWGKPYCTPEQYKALWHLTRRIFDEKGIDNVVWAYSPDKSNGQTYEEYMEAYPGDEYVDIMGADVYHFNGAEGNDTFRQWIAGTLGAATRAAAEHGKIVALTETGSETCPVEDWYSGVLWPAVKDYPIAYICVWRNAMPEMKKDHFYVPYKGHPHEQDFIDFYNLPQTVFLNDLNN